MKKLFVLLLVLVSAFAPLFAFAENDLIDPETVHAYLAEISTDDLLDMQKYIVIELEYRGYFGKETTVPVGKYTIGSDIPANAYTIKLAESGFSAITIYSENGGILTYYTVSSSAPIGKCELKDGQSIEIVGSPVIFSQYKGLGF